MNSIEKLIETFRKFPGIGPRQARRFVYFLLGQSNEDLSELAGLVVNLKKDITQCSLCYRFFKNQGEVSICNVCASPNTDNSTLMVIEKDVDFDNIQKTAAYHGRYFILGGTIPILEQDPGRKIRAKELFSVVRSGAQKDLKEVIIALSVTAEGENTTQYVQKILEPVTSEFGIKVSTLGRGLSTGTELEYSDSDTLQNALKNRA